MNNNSFLSNSPYSLSLLAFSLLMVLPLSAYAIPNPAEIRQQQDMLQRQRQEQQREQMQPQSDVRLDKDFGIDNTAELMPTVDSENDVSHASGDNQICFNIEQVLLIGEHNQLFQSALTQALNKTLFYPNKCLTATDINQIMINTQNIIIGRGYITTRILAAPQDLNSGQLSLTVLPGYLKNIEIDLSEFDQTHAGRISAFQNEFPTRSDGILNLRDLEQGLENLKRIPTAEANIQIVPVADVPNQSTVLITWQQRLLPYRFNIGIDDSGSHSTGKYQASATFSADNPFGLSDLFYVSYGHAIGHTPNETDSTGSLKKGGTYNYAIHYSVPFGKWTWSWSHSGYRYHQAVAGLNEAYDYNGKSNNTDFGFNRLLYRDAHRKTYLAYTTQMRKSRLSRHKPFKLIELFVVSATARTAEKLVTINKNTAAYYFHRLHLLIYQSCLHLEILREKLKLMKIHGGTRKAKRGRGAGGKTVVFGLLKRNGKVYTVAVPLTFIRG